MLAAGSFGLPAAPMPAHLTRSRDQLRRDIIDACRTFDHGCKGYVTPRELKYVFVATLGFKPTKLEVENMIQANKETQQGIITYDQACHLVQRKMQYQDPHDLLRQLFRAFDLENRGFIVIDDLLAAANSFAPYLPLSTLLSIFHTADLDRNQKIGWKEFERVMMHVSATPANVTINAGSMSGKQQVAEEQKSYDLRVPQLPISALASSAAVAASNNPLTQRVDNVYIDNAPAQRAMPRPMTHESYSSVEASSSLALSSIPALAASDPVAPSTLPSTPARRLLPLSTTPSRVTFTPNPNR